MSSENLLEKVKKLRELTGVGFKDCKSAIDETNGNIEKSIELLRKKGIAKASKRMGRTAAEGLVCIFEEKNKFSMIEINSETDFVAKNNEFINFAEETCKISMLNFGKIESILNAEMKNKKSVKDCLVDLVSKIGEKITLRRSAYLENDKFLNFSYIHSSLKKNVGKLGVLLSLETKKQKKEIMDLGKKLNTALAVKVGELNRYKSEFFGRLRAILGDRTDIEIVGDRFIFQSEVLFDSGSADLGEEGLAELSKLSRILLDITRKIPQDIPWVIQIQGHTDPRPIKTVRFPSNWELSTARAISVAKVFMIEGLSAAKISVAGFAEFQPLEIGDDEEALRKNRRIEIKLTQP